MPEAHPYTVLAPLGPVRRVVDELCGLEIDPTTPDGQVLPVGASVLSVRMNRDGQARIEARGPHTRASALSLRGAQWVVGAELRPGQGRAVLGVALDTLVDRAAPLDALWADGASALLDRVCAAPTVALRLQALLGAVEERLVSSDDPWSPRVLNAALRHLESTRPRVRGLAGRLGTSERQLRRLFQDRVGMSPKAYASLVRFRRAMDGLYGTGTLSEIARTAGYYDEAHMSGDFRRRLGTTPGALRTA